MCLEEKIKVIKIAKDKENILKNLMSLYLHDLSEFADDLKINEEGKFEYEGLEYYFMKKERMNESNDPDIYGKDILWVVLMKKKKK